MAGEQQRYFLHHVEPHMVRDEPRFAENMAARGTYVLDSSNRRAKILEEHVWTGLNVPCGDQEEEGTVCCEVAVTDTIQMRMQIKEKRKPVEERDYFGGVVGDKLSPKHVEILAPEDNGCQQLDLLQREPVTTKLEFDQKQRTNSVKQQPFGDMTGCSSHTIKFSELIMGDFIPGSTSDPTLLTQFKSITNHLIREGPLFGSLRDYGETLQLLGDEGRLYNMTPDDVPSDDPDIHGVSIVGCGRCEFDDGHQDVYWVVQNTWGEIRSTKFGRAGNDVLYYAVNVVV